MRDGAAVSGRARPGKPGEQKPKRRGPPREQRIGTEEAARAHRGHADPQPPRPSLPEPSVDDAGCRLYLGDCVELLRALPDASVDAVVTDPPAGIEFMGAEWDTFRGDARQPGDEDHVPGSGPFARAKVRHGTTRSYGRSATASAREAFVSSMRAAFAQCLRVLRPGGHALVWALPRTSHWTAWAVEDAGFEVREVVTHHFGNGFPKSLSVSKAIDKAIGAVREPTGTSAWRKTPRAMTPGGEGARACDPNTLHDKPATDEARRWDGFGTALKPASEHWILARKPLDGTVAENVLRHGTGGINVDACRVGNGAGKGDWPVTARSVDRSTMTGPMAAAPTDERVGRWPTNLLLTHSASCRRVGEREVSTGTCYEPEDTPLGGIFGAHRTHLGRTTGYAGDDGTETVAAYDCVKGECPVAELDRQSGDLTSGYSAGFVGEVTESVALGAKRNQIRPETVHADTGGASRFFPTFEWSAEHDLDPRDGDDDPPGPLGLAHPFLYQAKAPTAKREDGCEALPPRQRAVIGQRRCAACGRQEVNVSGACACPEPRLWVEAAAHSPRRNHHATVKPVALMRWLVRLVTPPGGLVLDPFAGSGTTLVAARLEGFRAVGFEREAEYVEVARGRVLRATQQRTIFDGPAGTASKRATPPTATAADAASAPQLALFGAEASEARSDGAVRGGR